MATDATAEILASYISKLSHPLKEIRERALQLLIAKLQLGWELDDELAGTRRLLESLLSWFQGSVPTLQREVLELLLTTIKTKSGAYIAKEFGIKKILANLNASKDKIAPDAIEAYDDVVDTLRFINTVDSEENVMIPRLTLPDIASSESATSSGYYNLDPNNQTSKETSISNDDYCIEKQISHKVSDGIRVLLFPWVDLCPSDSKTMLLIEDALRLLKSTRRCCRFICDVFLWDFPAEIFLNRPGIIKNLVTIAEGSNGSRPNEALRVLLCITNALRKRLLQLSSLDIIHEASKLSDDHKDIEDEVNVELEQIADGAQDTPKEDGLVALRQLPAPLYALDTLNAVLSIMARSVVDVEILSMKELNLCACLVESLIELLLDCVTDKFWTADHNYKTHRDISHKSCMVMRLLGDLLMKYSKSFYEDTDKIFHRVAWLRLTSCGQKLLHWVRESALPPTSIVAALQAAQIEPAVDLFYPELSRRITTVLQSSKITSDQEYKTKYRQLNKICASMEEAVKFMKNKDSCRNTKKALNCIKKSLLLLEIFQSEAFLNDIADFLLLKTRIFDMNDSDWAIARSITLNLMANNIEWVSAKFYRFLAEMVKSVLIGDEAHQLENEKCLTLLCDVSILTEICCHGLSSKSSEVEESASEIVLYLLRGRMALSDGCWWRLLASLLPVLPLLHVYAAHDTLLGQAICKSLDKDIAECMGVSMSEIICGLVRLVFVKCVAVQLDAAHTLCRLLDDDRYLPPKEALRADVLLNALRRIEPQDFNVDLSSSPTKTPQATGLTQMLDVLKQDIVLDEHGTEYVTRSTLQPALEPSLRRNTLQQLSVMMRQQDLHETFLQYDGLKVIVAILRMSLMVDDYLAFPECAISCVSVLNSVCFASRHNLAKISDLPSLLIRVILVFPANDSAVLLSAQVLSLVAWAGFSLQELDASRHRVPALPLSVTERTALPFIVNSYWNSSPNAEHSYVEWLLAEENWRTAIRVHWWCANVGRSKVLLEAPPPPAPLALRPCARDLALLRTACPIYSCTKALLALENATSHRQVTEALNVLESYTYLIPLSSATSEQLSSLPWQHTKRFFTAPPASSRDATLVTSLLQFVLAYMNNVPTSGTSVTTISWIKSSFIGTDATIISLLSRAQLYPQQTPQENLEVTQIHIHIVKVLIRCVVLLEGNENYESSKMESLLKILLACLERIDLKNFHMLGYLNELMRCIRHVLNSRFCFLSEDTLIHCLKITSLTLTGCAAGGGMKGQACRLDAMLSLLALLRQIHEEAIPVQRWSEVWSNDVVYSVLKCTKAARAELRAASLHVFAALAFYPQLLPHLMQAINEQSLSQFAARIFAQRGEANIVRAAAASLLTAVCSRASSKSDVLECDVLEQLEENNFIENCLDILVNFNNSTDYVQVFEPNISISVLERRSELEVRAQKCGDVRLSPVLNYQGNVPPTAALVATIADLLTNVSAFNRCPVQQWNGRSLYRLLFRCASWRNGPLKDVYRVRAAACYSLVAVTSHKCVRLSLSATKDCLHNLLSTLTPFGEDEVYPDCFAAKNQALLLLSSLLVDRSAVDSVWRFLRDERSDSLLFLVLQCLESDETELQDTGLYCLTQLVQSAMNKKHADKSKDESCIEFYDDLKSPFDRPNDKFCSGDGGRNDDCQPEYLSEEFSKALMDLYNKISLENKKYQTTQDERWSRVCSCIASVAACSDRSRHYFTHRQFPRTLLSALHAVRDQLSVRGKPVDVLRQADTSPVLRTLYWLLTVVDCSMSNCRAAKDSFADENMVASLNRLWVWCMMTDQLRIAVMHLLFTFTNECPKAWGAMCVCVGGHSLIGEVCALCVKETSLQSRPRSDALLLLTLHTIRHCVPHHHCRSLILKSEVMSSMYKLCVRERARGCSSAGAAWAVLCGALSAHADGAAAMLAAAGALAALAGTLRARLLPAVAHAASHHRTAFLHSPDLLELLSGTLLSGDTAEIISAARAVWALAANHHKAKLLLRSAGVVAAVQSTLQRALRGPRDPPTERMIQILTYTNTVLQTT